MFHLHESQRASLPWRRLLISAAALSLLAISGGSARAAGAERSLAGISIFAPGSEVTRKFGNPSQILVGGVAPGDPTAGGTGSGPGGPGASSGSPSPYPGSSSGGSSPYPGSSTPSNPGAGLLPGFPGVPTNQSSLSGYPGQGGSYPGQGGGEFPGAPGVPGALGTGGAGDSNATAAPVKEPVTLIYNRQNGGSLEFTISPDKRVVQIRETGYSGAYATTRGIRLGTSYAAVVGRYGYPENTTISGPIINIDYKDTLHCGFQFLNQKLVAIIVAAPD